MSLSCQYLDLSAEIKQQDRHIKNIIVCLTSCRRLVFFVSSFHLYVLVCELWLVLPSARNYLSVCSTTCCFGVWPGLVVHGSCVSLLTWA